MLWRWVKRPETTLSEFGSPLTTTAYAFCIYDYDDGSPHLVMGADVEPGGVCAHGHPCWKQIGTSVPRGFLFRDFGRFQQGVAQIVLKANEAKRKAKILFHCRGANLRFRTPASADRFFSQNSMVKIQLVSSEGECWEANYRSGAIRNHVKGRMKIFKDQCGTSREGPCE